MASALTRQRVASQHPQVLTPGIAPAVEEAFSVEYADSRFMEIKALTESGQQPLATQGTRNFEGGRLQTQPMSGGILYDCCDRDGGRLPRLFLPR
jgi:hypothetical protein